MKLQNEREKETTTAYLTYNQRMNENYHANQSIWREKFYTHIISYRKTTLSHIKTTHIESGTYRNGWKQFTINNSVIIDSEQRQTMHINIMIRLFHFFHFFLHRSFSFGVVLQYGKRGASRSAPQTSWLLFCSEVFRRFLRADRKLHVYRHFAAFFWWILQ